MKTYETKIIGTGHFVPEKVITNDDLSKLVDTNHQWIVERTGIHERRVCDPEKGEFPVFMATNAAKEAIQKSGIDPNDIDMIMFSITVADMHFPNAACMLQLGLGITNKCPCVDISAACTGWVYGLTMANALIQTGVYKNILLIGAEMTSRFNDWTDRNTCILFGDGAGATLLTRAPEGEVSKVHSSALSADSANHELLILPAGGAKKPITKEVLEKREQFASMNGPSLFKAAVKTMATLSAQVLKQNQWSHDDLDWFVPHQANQRIIEAVAHILQYPMEKVISNVKYYGNTSSASIPIALNEAIEEGKIKRGDNLLFAAFGAGVTSGAVSITY